MQDYTEISLAELKPFATGFAEALRSVCESPAFKTSPKSCQFLRHIVHRALDGDTDELKERLIGMSLLGREATYDTGSDAGVRVRANDVRKRLTAYNKTAINEVLFTFDLPSGSYIPRFFRRSSLSLRTEAEETCPGSRTEPYDIQVPLSLPLLAAPTVIALFLCVVCLRWQIAREHPFSEFWQSVFQGHSVKLYMPPSRNTTGGSVVTVGQVQSAAPLLKLAAQFNSELNFTADATTHKGDTLIVVGPAANGNGPSQYPTDGAALADTGQLEIVDTEAGRRIFDRSASKVYPVRVGSAALLTISNTPARSIRIDGTDEAAIDSLVRMLCTWDTFPDGLADDLTGNSTTQVVFPTDPHSQPIFFREPQPSIQDKTGGLQ